MTDKKILVIDDSATIRKLVDTHLSPVGYQVVLAPTAEEGLALAEEIRPDLILLDHQLPGTTGFDVASQLEQSQQLCSIPVVISSTLRKKAYAEYIELDNVVDMLPKPYTEDLLRTTVANALETATMIVQSQSDGTAIPEVIGEVGDASLAGDFSLFGLREVIDFLNNGEKSGTLEIEADRTRLWLQLDNGRIQGVSATGISESELEEITERLPQSLVNLAPVLKMTIGGQSCAEMGGFVQLLDQKVLDPRLLSKLLRFQASMLLRLGFTKKLSSFRFETHQRESSLHKSLPLNISLLALLIEGSLYGETLQASSANEESVYVRRSIRGQNLDRAGLSARHMKILNLLSTPRTVEQLAQQLQWELDEVVRVLDGFMLAELVEQQQRRTKGDFVVFEPNADAAEQLRRSLATTEMEYEGKVVRDRLALQLILKRSIPNAILFSADDASSCSVMKGLFANDHPSLARMKRVAIGDGQDQQESAEDWSAILGFQPDAFLARPCTAKLISNALDRLQQIGEQPAAQSQVSGLEQQADAIVVSQVCQPIATGASS